MEKKSLSSIMTVNITTSGERIVKYGWKLPWMKVEHEILQHIIISVVIQSRGIFFR